MTIPRGKLRWNKCHQESKTNVRLRGPGSSEQKKTNEMLTPSKTDNLIVRFTPLMTLNRRLTCFEVTTLQEPNVEVHRK
jgi:hypothetical protein